MSFEKTSYDAIEVINDEGNEVFGASEGFQRMKKDRCRYGYHIFKNRREDISTELGEIITILFRIDII